MKFGNLLRDSAEGLPEVQALFASYKVLKKRLKRLPERSQPQDAQQASEDNSSGGQPPADAAGDQGEEQFVQTLLQDVANFNDVFIEKEEDAVIVLRTLEEAAEAAVTAEALQHVLKRYVDFHGEMLLLVHWSILAYTGLVKILKKHHKRTGLLVRAPQLQNLLGQPFCSTELMTDFVHKAELKVDELARRLQLDGASLPASSVSAVPPLDPS
ncbi:hypothetical protein WJX72_001405 [[Myrmecia] bisecta]|uniref:SPX domain-containing protein n=1 Tax=[Myrmecia] bisecta TaxID=41462 RepID=A0AAW1PAP4_9CHLO